MSDVETNQVGAGERAFAERAIRRKRLFLVLSNVSVAVAVMLAAFYGYERLVHPEFSIGPRAVIILLILLNARQNLRQHKYAAILEKILPCEPSPTSEPK
jgi:hypothetical protein